jgi:hypothetical protein
MNLLKLKKAKYWVLKKYLGNLDVYYTVWSDDVNKCACEEYALRFSTRREASDFIYIHQLKDYEPEAMR